MPSEPTSRHASNFEPSSSSTVTARRDAAAASLEVSVAAVSFSRNERIFAPHRTVPGFRRSSMRRRMIWRGTCANRAEPPEGTTRAFFFPPNASPKKASTEPSAANV